MEQLFLTILNRAVTAGWLVLLVMVLRVVLKKAPRAAHYGLWAIVAVRLLWPGDLLPRAGVSLVPTTEPISGDVLTAAGTAVSGGLPAVGSPAGAAAAETAARTGQSLGHIAAVVWLVGMAAMALYLAGSYVRLRVRLRTAGGKANWPRLPLCWDLSGPASICPSAWTGEAGTMCWPMSGPTSGTGTTG